MASRRHAVDDVVLFPGLPQLLTVTVAAADRVTCGCRGVQVSTEGHRWRKGGAAVAWRCHGVRMAVHRRQRYDFAEVFPRAVSLTGVQSEGSS